MSTQNVKSLIKFDKIVKTLKARAEEIKAYAKEKGPDVLANTVYLYTVCRIPSHKRKTRGIEHDMLKESTQIFELFLPDLINNFSKLSVAGMYRLNYALENSMVQDVYEIYSR